MNVEHRTSNAEHRIKERLRRSILFSILVATFFLAKKKAFVIDRMVERSDIILMDLEMVEALFSRLEMK